MCIRDRTNVLGTVNLLQCAKNAWCRDGAWAEGKKYLQVSTDEVYGSLGEDGYFMETTPLCPHSPYSSSKASADMFVMAFHDTYGMPVNITRCSNNYGPYQFPEKLIPLMINNVKHHKPVSYTHLDVYKRQDLRFLCAQKGKSGQERGFYLCH